MFIILASDPVEKKWSIIHQSEDADAALDALDSLGGDPSLRIGIDTNNYITFDVSEVKSDG